MKQADRIRIRPFFTYDAVDGKILPPKLSIEINGEVYPLRSSVEIEGRIVERRSVIPVPIRAKAAGALSGN